jgi:hypothetical protein
MPEEVIDRTARKKMTEFESSFGDLREEFDEHRSEFKEHRSEFRRFADGSFRAHEQADQDRQEIAISEFAKLGTKLTSIDESVKKIEGRQWEETSKTHNLPPSTPQHRRMSPEVRQGGVVAGLVAAVIALTEAIKFLAHPASPPPPNTAQIAAEVAKALTEHAVPSKP